MNPLRNRFCQLLAQPPGIVFASLATFVLVCFLYSSHNYFNVVDDAYIGFVFVRSVVDGHGMVFNPGERVEGYTNFLWLIALLPAFILHRLSGYAFEPFAVTMNVASATFNLWATYQIASRLWPQRPFPTLVALALCLASNTFAVNAVLGMENHFELTCMLSVLLLDLSGGIRCAKSFLIRGALLAALVMTRPDGLLFVVAWSLAHLTGASPLSRSFVMRCLSVFAVVYGAYFMTRFAYYGQLLPNTFYQKMGNGIVNAISRGWWYGFQYVRAEWYLPLALLVPVSWKKNSYFRVAFLFSVLHLLYIFYVGGDFYPFFRFLVILTPFCAIAVADVLGRLQGVLTSFPAPLWSRMFVATVGLSIAMYACMGVLDGPYQWEIVRSGPTTQANKRLFEWFGAQQHREGDSIALHAIGVAGFYSGLRIIDMHGLIHPEVARLNVPNLGRGKAAHERQMPFEMLLQRAPTYIRFGAYLESHPDWRPYGYYLRNDLPPHVPDRLLWVKDISPPQQVSGTPRFTFEDGLQGWRGSGSASVVGGNPVERRFRNQQPVRYFEEKSYLSTYSEADGDRSEVRWVSPSFELQGAGLCLLVGGGSSSRVGVYVLVDGVEVAVERGANIESFGRRCISLIQWKGRTAQVVVLDADSTPWGHIMVDDIFQIR